MKILLLDVYPNKPYRINKDQNGGYGTANNYGFGNSLVSKILRFVVKTSVDFPPHYIVQLAGELIDSGHEVKYSRKMIKNENFDIYVLSSSIVCHETELKTISELVKNNKIVFVTGPFATNFSEPYLKVGAKVIKGEPEMFFHKFDKNIEDLKNLPNVVENFPSYELDDLALPGWKIIFDDYVPVMKFIGKGPAISIYASKGCPYSCFYYCVYPLQQGRKVRLKSAQKVIDEMIYFSDHLNVKNFIFRDPVFSINRNHTVELCEKIISLKKNFKIGIETHLKNIDNELAHLLKKAGVNLIYVGIESSDSSVKANASRMSDTDANQILKINYLEKIGIKIKSMYIVGLPADTRDTYQNTFNYAKKINSTYAQFNVFTPYPGTPVFKEYEDKITAKTYEEFTQNELVFTHNQLSNKDIFEMLDDSYKLYYSNPSWVIKYLLIKIKSIFIN